MLRLIPQRAEELLKHQNHKIVIKEEFKLVKLDKHITVHIWCLDCNKSLDGIMWNQDARIRRIEKEKETGIIDTD